MSDAGNDNDEDQEDGGGNDPPSHTYLNLRVHPVWPRCFGSKVQDSSGATGATGVRGHRLPVGQLGNVATAVAVPTDHGFRNSI